MAYQLPNGSTFDFASGYTPFFTITAITRSANAMFTAAGHNLKVNQIVMIQSGWWDIDGRAFKVSSVSGMTFTLAGADTTDTKRNSGTNFGKVRGVTTWVPVSQILGLNLSGGEQQYTTYSPSRSGKEVSRPTTKTGAVMTIELADDKTLPLFATIEAASRSGEVQVQRLTLINSDLIVYASLASITKTPKLQRDQLMTRTITLALQGDNTRY
ncbi:phage tail tube protein [Pseudomonas sp. P8_250]|uniref:phage tail tube protein n=1 Tax=Pseudomonas sp. P8_250 TaxID=3043446 RepID=UPI002A36D4EF|nr:phage tail tube protein [Pseudomonas sp. P8_250]MDX9668770.1 phage tail tube protein [Pseudomonas sp. P8_250]